MSSTNPSDAMRDLVDQLIDEDAAKMAKKITEPSDDDE